MTAYQPIKPAPGVMHDMLSRGERAKAEFVETLQQYGGIDGATATRVMGVYLQERIARIDYGIGRVNVKHGAFLDRDVIRRAATMTREG